MKRYGISPKQLEDWNYNFALKKEGLPNVMKIIVELEQVNVNLLSDAFSRLVGSHESLRTHFPVIDGKIVQQVEDSLSRFSLAYLDGQTMSSPEEAMNQVILDMKDIKTGPLFRGFLVKVNGGRHLLCLLIHHMISDYWSTKIIRQDLLQIYSALAKGNTAFSLPPRMQLGEFIATTPELQEAKHQMTMQYWKEALDKADWQVDYAFLHRKLRSYATEPMTGKLPGAFNFGSADDLLASPTGEAYHWHMPEELFEQLKDWSKTQKVSLNVVILSALNLLGCILTGKHQILIQSHFAGRIQQGAEHIIGNMIGKLLLLTEITDFVSIPEFLRQVNEGLYQAMEKVIYNSAPLKDFPLTTSNFVFLNYIPVQLSDNGQAVTSENKFTACSAVESPLVCYAVEFKNLLRIQWSYHHLYFDRASVLALVTLFENILSRMAARAGDTSIRQLLESTGTAAGEMAKSSF